MRQIFRYGFVLLFLLLLVGNCATTHHIVPKKVRANLKASDEKSNAKYYLLQAGDEVEIKFFYHPELNELVTIRPDGKISLQLIEDLQVAGLTTSYLDSVITERYARFIVEPEVSIIVRKFSDQKVFVGGEVNKPGLIPLDGKLTLLAAIFQAGGTKNTAQLNNVLLLRNRPPHGAYLFKVDLKKLIKKEKLAHNLLLQPYDIIFVPKSRIAKINSFVEQYIDELLPLCTIAGFAWMYQIINHGH